MSIIPDDKVNEVRERASILEVVSDYVSLRKSGANYQGLCPFHGEKTPSFNVNPARGIFHCFGCGVGGNALTFLMKMEGLSFPEAVRFLAKKVGVAIDDRPPTPQEKQRTDEREALYRINDLAADYYSRVLLKETAGEVCRRYLKERGVDANTTEAYRLGFAPDKWDSLARHLEQKKIPLERAETLGLVRRKEGGGYYDIFRNRLLFTISDIQGRPIGFGGRVLDDSLPKYINSSESPIYRKSEVLFGANMARQAMREHGEVIVVEGYFDHLALYQADVHNVVATCGTAMTGEHLKQLQRYAGKIFTLFDSDSAGRKATCRAMDLFLDNATTAMVIELPKGEDPDSFLKKNGSSAFRECLVKARLVIEWYFRYLLQEGNVGSVEGKIGIVDELAPRLKKISDPVERDLYVKEASRVLAISERAFAKKIGGASLAARDFVQQRESKKGGVSAEDMLLALMGKYPEVSGKVVEYGIAKLFPAELVAIAEAIVERATEAEGVDWALILGQVVSPEERSRLAALFVDEVHLEEIDAEKAFEQCRMSRERALLKEQNPKALYRELAQLDPDSERYSEIFTILEDLRKRKSQL